MFPPLDLAKAKIHNTKKAVMFNLDQESDTIDFRYYGLRATHTGINKNIKQLLETKKAPNLKNFKDISEYILRENDYMSENEIEDTLEEEDIKSKGGNKAPKKMTVKLYEIGPRMTLQLLKIEEGLLKGNVVYHRLIQKTAEEVEKNRKMLKEKARQKEKMRKQQQDIVNEKMSKKTSKRRSKKKEAICR
jgi:ribosome biogenesis protein SSF1/2